MTVGRLMALITDNIALLVMMVAILISAVAVVYSKHQNRVEFVALQKLEKQRDQLNEEWERLLIEQSTYSRPDRIEKAARIDLKMAVPTTQQIRVIYQ